MKLAQSSAAARGCACERLTIFCCCCCFLVCFFFLYSVIWYVLFRGRWGGKEGDLKLGILNELLNLFTNSKLLKCIIIQNINLTIYSFWARERKNPKLERFQFLDLYPQVSPLHGRVWVVQFFLPLARPLHLLQGPVEESFQNKLKPQGTIGIASIGRVLRSLPVVPRKGNYREGLSNFLTVCSFKSTLNCSCDIRLRCGRTGSVDSYVYVEPPSPHLKKKPCLIRN